jgi:Protein of unknown function (DUF3455)
MYVLKTHAFMTHGPQMHRRTIPLAASALLTTMLPAQAGAAAGGDVVPDGLRPPAGEVLALAAHGSGVQIYECKAAKEGTEQFSWTLKAPEAELKDVSGKPLGKHYAGPTWEAADGSKVVGEVVAKRDAPDASAIPWLLLRAKSTSGNGIFAVIKSIQRVQTIGGAPPAHGCDSSQSGKESRVPYSAVYRFYKTPP